jgi:hypothetical protein
MNFFLRHVPRFVGNRLESSTRWFSHSTGRYAAEGRFGYPNERYEPTTITALDKDNQRLPLITGLYEDGFMIGEQDRIVGAIFSFPRQVVCWNVSFSRVTQPFEHIRHCCSSLDDE